ncbi:MAG: hypothetical protein PHS54_07295 [Clostridia bacterium]|nr:hypothetical protein [Clostridia bacterium]
MSAKKNSSVQENNGFIISKVNSVEPTYENASAIKKVQVRFNSKLLKIINFFKNSKDFIALTNSILDILVSGIILNIGMMIFGFPLSISFILSFGCLYWFFFKKIYQYLLEIVKEFALSKNYK